MRRCLILLATCLAASAVVAEEFGARFRDGYQKLRAGDPGAALA